MRQLIAVNLQETLFGNHSAISNVTQEDKGFASLVSTILPNVYVVAGIILFLYSIFGGFLLISSAGDPKKADEGKQVLTNAIIGFAIIFVSYWLIQIIEIITGIPILT